MEVANTLAYYDTATITAVKSFTVQAPGNALFHSFKPNQPISNLIILVGIVIYNIYSNKLERLTLRIISKAFKYLKNLPYFKSPQHDNQLFPLLAKNRLGCTYLTDTNALGYLA
jgi:hypothetical protein